MNAVQLEVGWWFYEVKKPRKPRENPREGGDQACYIEDLLATIGELREEQWRTARLIE